MKKAIALFMAFAFALTLGTAFAEEKTATPAAAEKAPVAEKAPAKHKKHVTKKQKKAKKEAAAPAPATK